MKAIKKRALRDAGMKPAQEKTESYGAFLNLGFYIAVPLLVSIFIGIALDRYFDTKPVFTLGFIVFGSIATLYNLVKLTRSIDASRKR